MKVKITATFLFDVPNGTDLTGMAIDSHPKVIDNDDRYIEEAEFLDLVTTSVVRVGDDIEWADDE